MCARPASEYNYNSPKAWKRPFKNAKKLLWGEVGKTFFGMATMAMTARTLGVADFGALAVLMLSVSIITQFITFESWQIVLRYGAEAIQSKNAGAYKHVVFFSLGLEVVAGFFGAIFLATSSELIISLFNIPPEVSPVLPWAGIILVFSPFSNISQGTLRLTDRFHVISAMNILPKMLNCLVTFYLFWIGAGLTAFIYKWLILSIINTFMLGSVALYFFKKDITKLNKEAQDKVVKPWSKGRLFSPKQEVWRFAFGLYTNSALGIGTMQVGTPILSVLLGAEAAGLYRIAEKISSAIASPVNKLLMPAVFTDMAWLNAKKNVHQLRKMVLRLGGISGAGALVAFIILIFAGKSIITLVGGADYLPAYGAMLVLTIGIVLHSTLFAVTPLILTSGWTHLIIMGRTLKVFAFIAIIYPLVEEYGLIGAALATLLSSALASLFTTYSAFKYVSKSEKS